MKLYDAMLFDLDGTLVDSNVSHAHAWSEACEYYKYKQSIEFFLPLIGMGGDFIFPLIDQNMPSETRKGISQKRKDIFLEKYVPELRQFKGSRELLKACRAAGLKSIVASSATEREAKMLIEIADVKDLIDVIACEADADQAKPAPDIVNAALKKAFVEPARALLVGDTKYDIEAATKAGVATIALRCGGSSDELLQGAVAIFDGPADLLEHLHGVLTIIHN